MTTAPAPRAQTAPKPRPTVAALDRWQAEARRHLDLMGYGPGAVELVAGTNAPSNLEKIALLVWTKATYGQGEHTREWVESERLGDLVRRSTRLAARWGNVYVSVGTVERVENPYKPGKLRYDRAAQLPRRCIIADDVTDLDRLPLPPSWATETSPGNFQVGYTADELLTPREAVRLAEGLALVMRCDPSGSDATQLVRLAGITLNTKPKCDGRPGNPAEGIEPEGWRVRLRAEGPRYPVATLARALLPGGMAELRRGAQQAEKPQLSDRVHAVETPAALANLEALGAALMASSRYQRFFTRRPQLAALARGERVTLPTIYGPRDSGSEQVAVLVSNLLTTGRPAETGGPIVPGLGAPPLEEIRAVALFWRKVLRPDKKDAAYLADVDGLLLPAPDGYRPAIYAPEATTHIPGYTAAAPRELAPAVHRGPGRPAGARAAQVERLGDLLAARVGERVTRPHLAALLDVGPRAVACYLATLRRSEGWIVELRAMGRGGLLVQKCDRNCPAESVIVAPESVIAPVAPAHHSAETVGAAPQVVHTPPDLPPCPAPPAAAAAPALDLEALARRIDEAAATIRGQVRTRVITKGPRAGLVLDVKPRATLEAVAALLPDMPADVLAEAWAYRKSWQRDADRFRAATPPALYKELRTVERALHLAERPAPLPWGELDPAERKRLALRKMRPADDNPRRAEALAEAQQRKAIAVHTLAVRRRKHNGILAEALRRELRRRGLSEAPPPVERAATKRGKLGERPDPALVARRRRRPMVAADVALPPRLDLGSVFDDYAGSDPGDGSTYAEKVSASAGIPVEPLPVASAPSLPLPLPEARRPARCAPPQHEAPPPATPGPWVERKPGMAERIAALQAGKLVSCAD